MHETEDRASLIAQIERAGLHLKLPATPLCLDDGRLLEYRHPTEKPMLWVSLITLAVLLTMLIVFDKREVLFAIVGIWLSMILTSLQAVHYNALRGAEVTSSQFPAIYQIIEELRHRFQMPPTRVFVFRKGSTEAEILGLGPPYVIALPSLLLDSLQGDELRYVLGRAMGQIRFGHTRLAILLGGDESTLPAVLSWVARIRDLIFAGYRRAQLLSADRIGILASGSVATAFEVQTKLAVGNLQLQEVHMEDLVAQAHHLAHGTNRLSSRLLILQGTTPPLIYRLKAMVEWAGLPNY
jgi:Zn-dependent protease with chaperone function